MVLGEFSNDFPEKYRFSRPFSAYKFLSSVFVENGLNLRTICGIICSKAPKYTLGGRLFGEMRERKGKARSGKNRIECGIGHQKEKYRKENNGKQEKPRGLFSDKGRVLKKERLRDRAFDFRDRSERA